MKKKESVIWRGVDDEALLLDTLSGDYYCLNHSGARMWTLFHEGLETTEVAKKIAAEFKIKDETALADVIEFAESLKNNGVVE